MTEVQVAQPAVVSVDAVGVTPPSSSSGPRHLFLSPEDSFSSAYTFSPSASLTSPTFGGSGSRRSVKESSTVTVKKDRDGNKIINEYRVVGDLGRGAYSKVKLVQHIEEERLYALKIMDKTVLRKSGLGDDNGLRKVQREIAILKQLDHPNIVNLFEVIDDVDSNKIYLVLEYAEFGSVLSMDRFGAVIPDDYGETRVSETNARKFMRSLTSALRYAHDNGVIHRDIKPENILLSVSGDVKLTDFGVSMMLGCVDTESLAQNNVYRQCVEVQGTPAFLAPELLQQQRADAPPDTRLVDAWALGATLFVLIFGRLPFLATTAQDMMRAITSAPLELPVSDEITISDELASFLRGALEKDPSCRMSIPDMMQHPWLTEHDTFMLSPRGVRPLVVCPDDTAIDTAVASGHNIELIFGDVQKYKHRRRASDPANPVRLSLSEVESMPPLVRQSVKTWHPHVLEHLSPPRRRSRAVTTTTRLSSGCSSPPNGQSLIEFKK
eukprot:PhM_4_TR18027/c9_g1_i1/m.93102/K07359/CAMKK2; calcium/calmodulin-dependent protein kinase kinase 2